MKRRNKGKKLFALFLTSLSITLGSCSKPNPHANDEKYQIYLKATAAGYEGTYLEWLDSIKGEDGKDGTNGKDGAVPYIGENGNWWIGDHDTGISATGPKGDTGSSGSTGSKGDKGDKGDQGEAGQDGKDGVDGKDGADGADGKDGEKGSQGEAGQDGKDGVDGKDGADGADGKDGEKGSQGEAGQDGLSAYEIYLKEHPDYGKTEEQWLSDLINGLLTITYQGEIDYIPNLNFKVNVNDSIVLPSRILAHFANGINAYVDVVWQNATPNTEFRGIKNIYGVVDGYIEKVKASVHVTEYNTRNTNVSGYVNGIIG